MGFKKGVKVWEVVEPGRCWRIEESGLTFVVTHDPSQSERYFWMCIGADGEFVKGGDRKSEFGCKRAALWSLRPDGKWGVPVGGEIGTVCLCCGKPLIRKRRANGKPECRDDAEVRKYCDEECREKHVSGRFWECVDVAGDGECWMWKGQLDASGYGRLKSAARQRAGKSTLAHRVSWEMHHGEIPKELDVLHTCDVRACVSPHHLYLGTDEQNAKDRSERNRHGDSSKHLTAEQVAQIKSLKGRVPGPQVATMYGFGKQAIYNIWSGKTWTDVEAQVTT